MGFMLFTSSGSFKPATYGLNVGDLVQVIVVGGGAGGDADSTKGSAGAASSFGSYVTAAGGAVSGGGIARATTLPYPTGSDIDSTEWRIAGEGGDGWIPGAGMIPPANPEAFLAMFGVGTAKPDLVNYNLHRFSAKYRFSNAGNVLLGQSEVSARTDGRAGNGQVYLGNSGTYYSVVGGCGGIGWGAGGGGGMRTTGSFDGIAAGGGAGKVVYGSVKLSSIASIPVTVGNGGAGATYSSYKITGGGGCRGCVAVFW